MRRFEDLDVWKRSSRLCVSVYKELANCKDYGFKDQITRSSLSIPSNIAEGYERGTDKDSSRFFYYAKGSCGELRTQIYIGIEIGYIKKEIGLQWKNEVEQLSKMLSALIKSRSS
ncbi:MAG: four helix bundle protein [Methylomarinum sp.]|nr:four helix bundle protein [Methylomarinum sp.]